MRGKELYIPQFFVHFICLNAIIHYPVLVFQVLQCHATRNEASRWMIIFIKQCLSVMIISYAALSLHPEGVGLFRELWQTDWRQLNNKDCVQSHIKVVMKSEVFTLSDCYSISYKLCTFIKPLIWCAPNSKTWVFLISSCSCLCPIHWS